jgi:O-Antigen ligase
MLVVSLAFATWFGSRHGKFCVLGGGMAVSLLAGTWFEIEVLSTPINVTMATAVVLLVIYCTHSWREIFKYLNWLDIVIGSLTIWHIIVDVYYDGEPLTIAARAYGQWMLPYAAGRYAFLHRGSLTKLSPVFTTVAVLISVASVFEAFTSMNLWEQLFAEVDDKVTRVKGMRYGLLYRAIGPTRNPIFLGIVLLSLVPFTVEVISRSGISRRNQLIGFVCLVTICLGILATVSRGPVLCVPVAIAFGLAYWNQWARRCVLGVCVIGIILVAFNFDAAINLLESGGDESARSELLEIDSDKEVAVYDGTRHRLLIPEVYGPIMFKGGPLGYGTTASSGFPPKNLPGLPTNPNVLHRLRNVDNAYLNVGLAFGLVGLMFFVVLFVTAVALALKLATGASTYFYPSNAGMLVTTAAVLFAAILENWTVHLSYDHAFWLVFQIGTIAGLASLRARIRLGDA